LATAQFIMSINIST